MIKVCFAMASSAYRGETFRGGFRRHPFAALLSCDPDVPMEGEDVVADGPSSAGIQDDRRLLPVQVGQVKGGDGEEAVKYIRVASDAKAVDASHNSPITGSHDLFSGFIHVDAEVEPRLSRINITDLTDDYDDDDDDVFKDGRLAGCHG